MSAVTLRQSEQQEVDSDRRIRWTRDQCEMMVDAEILVGRYELIDGEIINIMGQNAPHIWGVRKVTAWLAKIFGIEFVSIQISLDVKPGDRASNDPIPDVYVSCKSLESYPTEVTPVEDVLLLIEIADSSRKDDLGKKADLYSRSGISDYWVLDTLNRSIHVHRQPTPEGYLSVLVYAECESISPLSRPEATISAIELLPPVSLKQGELK